MGLLRSCFKILCSFFYDKIVLYLYNCLNELKDGNRLSICYKDRSFICVKFGIEEDGDAK